MVHTLDWDKVFKTIVATSAIIACLAVGYYFAFFLPQIERERLNQELKEREAAQLQKKQEKEEAARKNDEAQFNLDICLTSASKSYSDSWDAACKDIKSTTVRHYENCVKTLDESSCLSLWGADLELPEKDCSLPSARAENLNSSLQNAKDECYRRYPIQ